MFSNYNKFIILVSFVVISLVVFAIVILLCEINIFKHSDSNLEFKEESDLIFMDMNSDLDDINSHKIKENVILEVNYPSEIYIPEDNIKKDIFLDYNNNISLMKHGLSYKTNKKAKIEAFYYGEPYFIYIKKL